MRAPLTLAIATMSHGISAIALASATAWLASYAAEIRPLAFPLYLATLIVAFAFAVCAAWACRQSFAEFARLMAAPINAETMQ